MSGFCHKIWGAFGPGAASSGVKRNSVCVDSPRPKQERGQITRQCKHRAVGGARVSGSSRIARPSEWVALVEIAAALRWAPQAYDHRPSKDVSVKWQRQPVLRPDAPTVPGMDAVVEGRRRLCAARFAPCSPDSCIRRTSPWSRHRSYRISTSSTRSTFAHLALDCAGAACSPLGCLRNVGDMVLAHGEFRPYG